jgi:electron transport complex protein RnfD
MESMTNPLILSSSPHFHSRYTTDKAMRDVCLALVPAILAAVYFFGMRALLLIVVSGAAAVAAEYGCRRIMNRNNTLNDGSAALTGILLALCLPPTIPIWMAAFGAVCAIVIGKQVFGGLGQNIFNPAHIGRAILVASFPVQMTNWTAPRGLAVDAVTMATPLALMKNGTFEQLPSLSQMAIGQVAGSLGETSAIALILGGLYLIYKKHVDWRIPISYIGTVFVLTAVFGMAKGYDLSYAIMQVLSGGLLIGAFFMATDWVTSPITKKGRLIFGLGLGVLTCLIRFFGGLAEGVCYSILIMNILAPMIDRYTRGRVFGRAK